MLADPMLSALVRRAQAITNDFIFQKIKSQISTHFDFSVPGAMKLQNLILKLKKVKEVEQDQD